MRFSNFLKANACSRSVPKALTSPGYSSGGQVSIPYPLIIPVSKADEKRAKESEGLWEAQVRAALESQVILPDVDALTQALYERIEEAERLLPLPDEGEASASSSKSGVETDALDHFPKRIFTAPGLQE